MSCLRTVCDPVLPSLQFGVWTWRNHTPSAFFTPSSPSPTSPTLFTTHYPLSTIDYRVSLHARQPHSPSVSHPSAPFKVPASAYLVRLLPFPSLSPTATPNTASPPLPQHLSFPLHSPPASAYLAHHTQLPTTTPISSAPPFFPLTQMDSLRLPPLNFNSLPNPDSLDCVLPPISPFRHSLSFSGGRPSPSVPNFIPTLSPLFTATAPYPSHSLSPSPPSGLPYDPTLSVSTLSFSSSSSSSLPSSGVISSSLLPVNQPASHPPPTTMPNPSIRNGRQPFDVQMHPTPFESTAPMDLATLIPVKRSIHTPKGARDVYTCPFPSCTRISSEHSNMKAHMRLHTGERPYVCRVATCRKSFRWKSSLTYHERALHTNSRPFQCTLCQKSFVEKRKLRLHHQLCPALKAKRNEMQSRQYHDTVVQHFQV